MKSFAQAARLFMFGLLVIGLTGTADAAKKRKPDNANEDNATTVDAVAAEPSTAAESDSKPSDAGVDSDKDRARFIRALTKRFKKEDGYYVVRLIEVGVQPDAAPSQDPKDSNVSYKPYATVTFETLAGRDAAVRRIVEYLDQHNPPWEKSKAAGKANSASTASPPPPKRDWQPVGWFPASEEGAQAAEQARAAAQQARDAEIKAIEDRNKPKCAKCAKGR